MAARRKYVISQDTRSGFWYAHLEGFAYIPVAGSFSEKRSEAAEYAKMYNCLPNRVSEIEKRRKKAFESEVRL